MTAGREVTPKDAAAAERLHQYWVAGQGLAKWATSPHPWTALYHHLLKYMSPELAKQTASKWHFEVFHQHTGSDLYRLEHGGKIRGQKIGPG